MSELSIWKIGEGRQAHGSWLGNARGSGRRLWCHDLTYVSPLGRLAASDAQTMRRGGSMEERAGCGRDRRVHSNPATLVALIASYPVLSGFIIRNHRWPH